MISNNLSIHVHFSVFTLPFDRGLIYWSLELLNALEIIIFCFNLLNLCLTWVTEKNAKGNGIWFFGVRGTFPFVSGKFSVRGPCIPRKSFLGIKDYSFRVRKILWKLQIILYGVIEKPIKVWLCKLWIRERCSFSSSSSQRYAPFIICLIFFGIACVRYTYLHHLRTHFSYYFSFSFSLLIFTVFQFETTRIILLLYASAYTYLWILERNQTKTSKCCNMILGFLNSLKYQWKPYHTSVSFP